MLNLQRKIRRLSWHASWVFLIAACILPTSSREAQSQPVSAVADTLWEVDMREVVVTATRGARAIRSVPIPTQVVTARDVKEQGASRLADLLAEHPGLVVTHDQFGAGIQLQGFDSAYTLILINGEPLIGRQGGTIDLDRLPVGDIERIEIVRGPSSSLYGSEALAGVINIITAQPTAGIRADFGARYETHTTSDLNLQLSARRERIGARVAVNRYESGGYDLAPDVPGLTVPSFTDYTVSASLDGQPAERTELSLDARLAGLRQISTVGFVDQGQSFTFEEDSDRSDWSLAPKWIQTLKPGVKLTTKGYVAGSSNGYTLLNEELAEESSRIDFAQWYQKGEAQLDAVLGTRHFLTSGAGFVGEIVEADRVQGGRRTTQNLFAFGQHQWFASERLQVITSARLDVHSEYSSRLSPKTAMMITASDNLRVRASIGTGFKAPTFQQLYMDFTNPVAGYSVVGSSDITSALSVIEGSGQIAYYLTDPSTFASIRPENSVALNIGAEWDPTPSLNLQLNVFRNNVRDLIEHQPVAAKTNGQFVFSYVNLNRIYTQGVEAEARWAPSKRLSLALGYQFLDARDRDILEQIDNGTVYTRENGRDRRVSRADYGGLFNRSRHALTSRLTYRLPKYGSSIALRALYRSRYGFGDLNGNLILDQDREYVPGFMLVHATLTHPVSDRSTLQVGVKNLLGKTYPTLVPSLPGRLLFAGFSLRLES